MGLAKRANQFIYLFSRKLPLIWELQRYSNSGNVIVKLLVKYLEKKCLSSSDTVPGLSRL